MFSYQKYYLIKWCVKVSSRILQAQAKRICQDAADLIDDDLKRVRNSLTSYTEGVHDSLATLILALQAIAFDLAEDEQYR